MLCKDMLSPFFKKKALKTVLWIPCKCTQCLYTTMLTLVDSDFGSQNKKKNIKEKQKETSTWKFRKI